MAATNDTTGRDELGRFTAGNRCGRGRPRKEIEAEYLSAMLGGCPPRKMRAIVEKLSEMAVGGNIQAAKLLMQHAMPTHMMRLELASTDEEYRVAGETPGENMERMLQYIVEKTKERREYESQMRPSAAEEVPT